MWQAKYTQTFELNCLDFSKLNFLAILTKYRSQRKKKQTKNYESTYDSIVTTKNGA